MTHYQTKEEALTDMDEGDVAFTFFDVLTVRVSSGGERTWTLIDEYEGLYWAEGERQS